MSTDSRMHNPSPGRSTRARALQSTLTWVGLLVSAVFAYFTVRNVDFGDVWTGLRSSNAWWLVPAFGMLVVTVLLKALRWRYVFRSETRPPFRPVLGSLLIGYFFNNVLPARAGEAIRIVALRQSAGTSAAESAGTVVIERVFDVLCLLALLFLALPWLPPVTWLHEASLLAAGLSVGLLIAVVVLAAFGERPLRFVLGPLARLPFVSEEQVAHLAENLAHGFAALRQPKLALVGLSLTVLSWLTLAASMWLLTLGFDLDVPFVTGVLVVVAINLAMILPASPSAIGLFEAATLVALRPFGISSSQALSYALVLHALNLIPYLVAGLFLLRGSFRIRRGKAASMDADGELLQHG